MSRDKTWTDRYKIRTYEIDSFQRVSIHSVFQYLVNTAGNHAHELGWSVPQLLQKNLTWMLSRLLIRLRSYPGWRQALIVRTWPSGFQKLFALRDFELLDAEGLSIGEATSAWLLLDARRRRPVRPDSLLKPELLHPERSIDAPLGKLPTAEGLDGRREFQVRFSDLDMNQHVTAATYIDWLLESVPPEIRREYQLEELEINFLAESNYGDEVASLSTVAESLSGGGEPSFRHGLERTSDRRELVRGRTRWVPKP